MVYAAGRRANGGGSPAPDLTRRPGLWHPPRTPPRGPFMPRFSTVLVPGRKRPYSTWTFVEIPPDVAAALGGRWPRPVRGTIDGTPFRGTAARGEGVVRVPVRAELLATAGISRGDTVAVSIDLDTEPRPLELPEELARLLGGDAGLEAAFSRLAPSMRRAWASHVAGAKRAETRTRRVAAAADGIRAGAWPR